MSTTRRQFLAATASTLLVGPLARVNATTREAAGGFSFPLLGDLHFDRLEHHDMDWLMREKPGDLRQIERYSQITRDVLPSLLAEVRKQVADSPRPVPFVVQVGDLVEGLCGTPALARRHCEEAVATVADARLGAPLLLTKGNHDITGPGAKEAFDDVLLASMPADLRQRQQGANFLVRQDGAAPTRLAFFDSYDPAAVDWLAGALSDHDPAAERLMLVIHQPVVPYTARCWHDLARPEEADQRAKLLALLAAHDALVLNGHLHKYGWLTRGVQAADADGKAICQLSINSVIPAPDVAARDERGSDAYGPSLVELESRFSPDTVEQRRATLAAEAEFVRHYEYADAPGYAMVHVTPGGVSADLYVGLGRPPVRRLRLA